MLLGSQNFGQQIFTNFVTSYLILLTRGRAVGPKEELDPPHASTYTKDTCFGIGYQFKMALSWSRGGTPLETYMNPCVWTSNSWKFLLVLTMKSNGIRITTQHVVGILGCQWCFKLKESLPYFVMNAYYKNTLVLDYGQQPKANTTLKPKMRHTHRLNNELSPLFK